MVADPARLGGTASHLSAIDDIEVLVTDVDAGPAAVAEFSAQGIEILIV